MSWDAGNKLENIRKGFSLRAFRKEHGPDDMLILVRGDLCQTSEQ